MVLQLVNENNKSPQNGFINANEGGFGWFQDLCFQGEREREEGRDTLRTSSSNATSCFVFPENLFLPQDLSVIYNMFFTVM